MTAVVLDSYYAMTAHTILESYPTSKREREASQQKLVVSSCCSACRFTLSSMIINASRLARVARGTMARRET